MQFEIRWNNLCRRWRREIVYRFFEALDTRYGVPAESLGPGARHQFCRYLRLDWQVHSS